MLSTRSSELPHKTVLIKQDDKFFTRLLSRELSMSRNNKMGSFRGLPSSVPFVWESHPGTPKHRFHSGEDAEGLPPLTPPPSFYSSTLGSTKGKKQSGANLIKSLFHKLNILRRAATVQASSPTVSSNSSCSSWSSSVSSSCNRRGRLGSWGGYSSSSSSKINEEDGDFIIGSPTSTLCFIVKRKHRKSIDLQKKGLINVHGINL